MGGECIIFDPRTTVNTRCAFVGGISDNASYGPSIFRSADNGVNFSVAYTFPSETQNDTILCLQMHKSLNVMYIGTSKRLYKCDVDLNGNISNMTDISSGFNSGWEVKNIRRILLNAFEDVYVTYGAYYNTTSNHIGGGLLQYNHSTSTWYDRTGDFGNYLASNVNYLSTLTWSDNNENVVIVGRVDKPIRKSSDGINWVGEGYSPDYIYFYYDQINGNYPNHQYQDEFTSYMYGGLNYLVRNPNPNYQKTWYLSGGAGLRISDNNSSSSGIFFGKYWHYSTFRQSMPVIYDFSFEMTTSMLPLMHIPLADWSLAYTIYPDPRMGPMGFYPLDYDNQNTRISGTSGNSYISNVTRALIAKHSDPGEVITYNIGADTYYDGVASMYKKTRTSTATTPYRIPKTGILDVPDRAILDGLIYDYTFNSVTTNDMMVALIGTQSWQDPQPTTNIGVYWTTNGGNNFTQATFNVSSTASPLVTETQYSNSRIPSLAADQQFGVLYSDQFNLAIGDLQSGSNINRYLYAYFPGGGMFVSSDGGRGWATALPPTTTSSINTGCLKYLVSKQLLLAIKGKGLFYGYLNTDGTINSWSSVNGFSDASQVEVNDNIWVVFGKRSGDQFSRLYKTTNYGVDWKSFADGLRGVRALRIHPQTYELFIATTGLGTIIYNDLAPSTQPYKINNTRDIAYNTYYERDIEIDSGGVLNLSNNINFKMAPGKKIYVKEGGRFNATDVTFNCTDSTKKWEGIYFENSDDSCVVLNCTFNSTTLPIKIVNNESYAYNEKIIKNNIFNCQNNQDFAIYAENVFNILVQGNQFNMAQGSAGTVGIEVRNSFNAVSMEDAVEPCIIDIVGNTFTNGCASMVLNSYASELTPFYVYGNTFNGSSGHYNIIGRMMTGIIKNNNFSCTNTDNPFYLQQSNPNMFGNIINGGGTTMVLNGHSYPNLSPSRTGNTYYWNGGQNKLYSINAGNINIIDAGLPYVNFGCNQFSKNYDQSYFHITGTLDSTVGTFNATKNAWCTSNSNPNNYLYTSGNPSVLTDFNQNYSCNNLPVIQYSSSSITDMGFGIYDTLFISTDNTNSYIPPDELLYSQAEIYYSGEQYLDAINNFKSLINNNLESQYLTSSLYEIYHCYTDLDTSSNSNYRDNLYSDLYTFLNDKIQSGNYSSEFNDVAYYFTNMCKVNMQNYNDALTGFEFISMFHPDATMRLLASWDYEEVQQLMGQSGGEKENSEKQFRELIMKRLDNAIKKDSTMGIMSRIYKKQNDEIEVSYSNNVNNNVSKKETKNASINEIALNKNDNKKSKLSVPINTKVDEKPASKNDNKQIKYSIPKDKRENLIRQAENNLRLLKTMSKDDKIKKQKEDILMVAGLTSPKNKSIENANIPLSFNISQNFPNPFNPVTKINYELPKDGRVKLMIYDILGREIKTLVNEFKQFGKYTVEFNGSNLASGVYFYRIQAGDYIAVKRMVLVK